MRVQQDGAGAMSRRERVRAATVEEIKSTARRLMADTGTTEVRFTDIAREMGMTAPALYRYYRDRDELLTALLVEGYNDLADALVAGRDAAAGPADDRTRFTGIARAYRQFGREDPARYALVFGVPIPGYQVPEDAGTVTAAKRAMAALESVLRDGHTRGGLHPPLVEVCSDVLREHLAEPDLPPAVHQAMLHTWIAMHGFVSLEIYGNFDMIPPAARDDLYDAQVRLCALALGLLPD